MIQSSLLQQAQTLFAASVAIVAITAEARYQGVFGMGGADKTVLTQAIVYDEEIVGVRPDGGVVSGTSDGTVRVWDLGSGESRIKNGGTKPPFKFSCACVIK